MPWNAVNCSVLVSDRLESWKDIAAYLKRDVSTVQRWEKREGMPVHRHLHDKIGSVYAFPAELDAWWQSRHGAQTRPAPPEPSRSRVRALWWGTAAIAVIAAALIWAVARSDFFWRNPLANARFVRLADFEGTEPAAAISRDGRFVAFLGDRDGPVDVWVTQPGSGQFHNLTHGKLRELVNPDVRTIRFSPDGAFVTMWVRRQNSSAPAAISVWSIPTLGGEPALYFDNVAEFDWSSDGSRVVYHTPGPGDPMFVNDRTRGADRHIFTAPVGHHAHFPVWSPDDAFIYFVYGVLPNELDIWRIHAAGGQPERVTTHNSRVTHPTFVDRKTLLYLATDVSGAGPWLYALDVRRRKTRRISFGAERYTSLDGNADGRRLVVAVADPKRTLWRLPITGPVADGSAATPIRVSTNGGRSPRLGPDYVLYLSSTGDHDSIWKLTDRTSTELWSEAGARIIGAPAIAPDGRRIAFVATERGRARMYIMNVDGSATRVLPDSIDPRGSPAWSPDGRSIAVATTIRGAPALAKVSADGGIVVPLVSTFAADPAWSPDGVSIVYSGPDIGTTFQIRVVSADGRAQPQPKITLSRGARRLAFLPGQRALVVLRGEMNRQNFWVVDLATGAERRLTDFAGNVAVGDFDISPDGREIVFDREQVNYDIVLIER